MKELSIEEKAKRYDEALEKSKRLYEQGTITESLCYVFPELKESEDERIRKKCIHFLELQKSHHAATFDIEECIAWLKSLKDRVQPQPKQEWSEEDDWRFARIIRATRLSTDCNCEDEDWLKSIKNKVVPQSYWKPSEKQIKVCKEVYADILSAKGFDLGTINGELNRLEEELKKLKE